MRNFQKEEGFDPKLWEVSYLGSMPIGVVVSNIVNRKKHKTAKIIAIDIIPEYRRKGYDTILLERNISSLAKKGVDRIHLGVVTANTPAIGLYKKIGFKYFMRRFVKNLCL